jgi:hypothetical protein
MMMYPPKIFGWMCLWALFTAPFCSAQTTRPQYAVVQAVALHRTVNGIEGTLQLLMDTRLAESVREKLWGQGDWSFVLPSDSTLYKEFSTLPPGNSELRIIDSSGKVIAKRDLATPLAKLQAWNPASSANLFFLLTEDYSTGAGSYNGPGTIPIRVSDGAFHDVKALSANSHREESFRLMKSLKSDWRISSSENGGEILSVSCHPNKAGHFVVDYIRYSLQGTQWREYKREARGFWESGDPFPKRSAFP